MKLIDGKLLAQNLRGEIAAGVASLKAEKGVTPGLAVILVGDNPASVSYVTAKEKACREAGMLSREIRLPAETSEAEKYRNQSLRAFLRVKEKEYLKQVLDSVGGDKEKAAAMLKISLATLYRKLEEE